MKKALIGITAVIVVGAAWWLLDDAPVESSRTPTVDATPSPEEQMRAAFEQAADAGTAAVSGTVVDDDGTPVAGAAVALYLRDTMPDMMSAPGCEALLGCAQPTAIRAVIERVEANTLMPKPWATTQSDAEGGFSFPSAPAVNGQLIARKGELAGAWEAVDGIELTISPAVDRSATLKLIAEEAPLVGAKAWVVDARFLEAQPVISGPDGVVHALVHGDDAWVVAAPPTFLPETANLDQELNFGSPRRLVVKTRVGGEPVDTIVKVDEREFKTKAGEVVIEEMRPEVCSVSARTEVLSSRNENVDLSEHDAEVVIELRASGRLLLTLIDADGMPVKTVWASLENSEAGGTESTGEEGSMLVLGPVPEGEFSLTVRSDGFRDVVKTVDLKPGDNALEIVLSPSAVLEGSVVDDQGKPVAAADVEYQPAGGSAEYGRTDDVGHFMFQGSPVAEATIVASHDGTGRGEARVTLPGKVTVRLEPRAVFVLDVRTADGAALQEVRAVLGGRDRVAVSLDENGHGRVAGLRGGKWALEVDSALHPKVVSEVELAEGREVGEVIVLAEGVSLEGRVLDFDGSPRADASLYTSDRASATSDAQGNFALKGLAAGKVEIICVFDERHTVTQVVEAPARGVVIRLAKSELVSGRVVDDTGRAVPHFEANGVTFNDAEGRFSVASDDQLTVWAEGYDGTTLDRVKGDVGVVTLKSFQKIEGEVVDAQGKPVAGVVVRVAPGGGDEVFTLANGRFSTSISSGEPHDAMITASRGSLFASKPLERGRFVRLQLGKGTHVVGHVTTQGRPAAGVDVLIEGGNEFSVGSRSLVTDAHGAFELELAPGLWKFSAVGVKLSRTLEVSGDQASVELSADLGRCGLEIKSLADIVGVVLEPLTATMSEGYYSAGTVHLSGQPRGFPFIVGGLPCGEFQLSVQTLIGSRTGKVLLEAHTVFDATTPQPPDPPDEVPEPVR